MQIRGSSTRRPPLAGSAAKRRDTDFQHRHASYGFPISSTVRRVRVRRLAAPALTMAKVKVIVPGARDMARASGGLLDDVEASRVSHSDQPQLNAAVAVPRRRQWRCRDVRLGPPGRLGVHQPVVRGDVGPVRRGDFWPAQNRDSVLRVRGRPLVARFTVCGGCKPAYISLNQCRGDRGHRGGDHFGDPFLDCCGVVCAQNRWGLTGPDRSSELQRRTTAGRVQPVGGGGGDASPAAG